MEKFVCFGRKQQQLCDKHFRHYMSLTFQVLVNRVNSFWVQLGYFFTVSMLGFLALKISKPRAKASSVSLPLRDLDLFFTSVSATTVSSMSTVEMEVFSNFQLAVMTVLMLAGGEVFTSMIGLHLARSCRTARPTKSSGNEPMGSTRGNGWKNNTHHARPSVTNNSLSSIHCLELQSVPTEDNRPTMTDPEKGPVVDDEHLKYNSLRCLAYVVFSYVLVVHVLGSSLITAYIGMTPSAQRVLRSKGIPIPTFSVFTVVSTFANCGFVPTNENMMVFKDNSGLLLLLLPHVLFGNTLYPACLRLTLWALEKATRRKEFGYILQNGGKNIEYEHLLSGPRSRMLGLTVLGFTAVQLVLFCSMEWRSEAMEGISPYRKLVGALFQTVNSRHSGESVFDISVISPAILVLFVVMMYLPPYTSFSPIKDGHEKESKLESGRSWSLMECLNLSQLSYLIIFIILICITEREKLKTDPLNFNILNITIEVISAYGNVGFSTGYSCKRQIHPDGSCTDTWYGLAGRWSNEGKFILVLVMFFGRLKKFSMRGGKAWKLS